MSRAADDHWQLLRSYTRARIGIGRAGDGVPTAALLAFQASFARARDAVHEPFDTDAIRHAVAPWECLLVASQALNREQYLRRPDLGRRLDEAGRLTLSGRSAEEGYDVAFVIADGLSSAAAIAHCAPVLRACIERLQGFAIAPIVVASQARVALGDEIGSLLGARLVVIMIGERPGLSVACSLGLYITWAPTVGMLDARRNCISNIHVDGLSHAVAGEKAAWLIREASRRRLSGIDLKDEARPGIGLDGPFAALGD